MDGSNFECRTKMFTNYLLTSVFLLQNNRMTADNFIIGGLHRGFHEQAQQLSLAQMPNKVCLLVLPLKP